MIPVFQSVTDHNPEEGRFGDCLAASIASIFEIPLAKMPNFNEGAAGFDGDAQTALVRTFCLRRSLQFMWVAMPPEALAQWRLNLAADNAEVFHVFSGKSKRGFQHACVGLNGRVVHDPHPAMGEIEPYDGLYTFGLFLPTSALLGAHTRRGSL